MKFNRVVFPMQPSQVFAGAVAEGSGIWSGAPPDVTGDLAGRSVFKGAKVFDHPALAGAATPTPTVQGGTAVVEGAVIGPDGKAVAGATVRLERLVGDASATLDVTTTATGAFVADRLLGGRYRVRAWRAPTLTQDGSEVAFVTDGERRSLTIGLTAPNRLDVTATLAPTSFAVGQTGTLVVRALLDVVAPDGRIDKVGRPGQAVTAAGTGAFSGQAGQAVTDAAGAAAFTFRCTQPGTGTVTVGNGVARQTVTAECQAGTTTTGPATATTAGR